MPTCDESNFKEISILHKNPIGMRKKNNQEVIILLDFIDVCKSSKEYRHF